MFGFTWIPSTPLLSRYSHAVMLIAPSMSGVVNRGLAMIRYRRAASGKRGSHRRLSIGLELGIFGISGLLPPRVNLHGAISRPGSCEAAPDRSLGPRLLGIYLRAQLNLARARV